MTDFTVVVASPVGNQLIQHTEFLARVSVPAAKRFRNEYANKKTICHPSVQSFTACMTISSSMTSAILELPIMRRLLHSLLSTRLNLRDSMALARFSLATGVAARWKFFSGEAAENHRAGGKDLPVFAGKQEKTFRGQKTSTQHANLSGVLGGLFFCYSSPVLNAV